MRLLPVLCSIELPEKVTPAPEAVERAAYPALAPLQLDSWHLPDELVEPDLVRGALGETREATGGATDGVGRRVHKHEVNLAAMGSCWQPPMVVQAPLEEDDEDAEAEELELQLQLELELELAAAVVGRGMFLMAVILMGLDTRFDSDLMGDCSSTGLPGLEPDPPLATGRVAAPPLASFKAKLFCMMF